MAKILIINRCWDCMHITYEDDILNPNLCWESKRMKLNNNGADYIENPDIIDPGCQLEDAKE